MEASSKTVIDVLAKTPQPHRKALIALRRIIRRLLPRSEEGISYGMPCFKVDGKGVAGFAAFQSHCTYFPMSGSVVRTLGRDLSAHQVSKGGVQFSPDEPLSPRLVRKLITARLEELSRPPASGNGPARSYYGNGMLRSKGSYRAGKKHGTWTLFRRDGSVMQTGEFRDGAQVGSWRRSAAGADQPRVARGSRSWQQKLRTDHGLPKVEPMPTRMQKQWGKGKRLVPAPREVDALMKKVPRGKLTTIDALRASLATRHGADVAYPMTAGMFANIVARAADEAEAAGKTRITPYWRTLKARGELNPKFPGGLAALKTRLEVEGHAIEVRGRRMFVANHEKRLVRPIAD